MSRCASQRLALDLSFIFDGFTDLVKTFNQDSFCCRMLRTFSSTMIMMIAFITIKGGLVPWWLRVYALKIYFRFEIIGAFAFTSFAFLFRKKMFVKEKRSSSKISSRLLAYTY